MTEPTNPGAVSESHRLAGSTAGFDLRYGNRSPRARLKFCETECGGLASCPISNRCANWVDRGLWDKPATERAKRIMAELRRARQSNAGGEH